MGMLEQYLLVSVVLFVLGVFGTISRRNAVGMLIGIELVLNAASLSFVAFGRYILPFGDSPKEAGQVVSVFIIILAACEAVVALTIVYALYRLYRTVDVDQVRMLRQ
jgi:NADH:ubiquinone oxidoreductase subunit K